MKKYIICLNILFVITFGFSQDIKRKTLTATRVTNPPKIDGNLNDAAWQNVPIAKNFVMVEPGSGSAEPIGKKTEVKLVYDDQAIYIAAYLYDSKPNTIMKQLSDRDNFVQADVFGVTINPHNDKQNDTEFFVSAGGTQIDAKVSAANGEDFSWNDVWYSKVKFDNKGWYVEMKIPYSALRFSNQKVQTWGINFYRNIQSTREEYTWNLINKTKGNLYQYSGLLTNLKNIKAPIRLNILPIATTNLSNFEGTTLLKSQLGLDIKYGLTDNFTLDATINPDFSQTGFDNLVLNLGPFETHFNEQRQFFVEGADLLNKGNMFFSRRIGKTPIDFYTVEDNLKANETILKNPEIAKLLAAVKVSGRTKKGLGIAVLDAVTDKTEAIIKNNDTQQISKVTTEPFANYNVFVIDQEFNKNSSVSFVNTNVTRQGDFRKSNASALLLNLSDKANANKYRVFIKTDQVDDPIDGKSSGYATGLSYDKTKGNLRFGLRHRLANDKYDINDLGFQRRNNYNSFFGNISYRIFKPTKHFKKYNIRLNTGLFRRFKPSVYTGNYVSLNFFATTLKEFTFGGNVNVNIGKEKDYNEPRNDVNFYITNPSIHFSTFVSTDFRKKFAFNTFIAYSNRFNESENGYSFGFTPIYRANDKFFLSYSFDYDITFDEKGYVDTLSDDSIIFGIRNNKSIVNSLSGKYSFSDLASLTISFRYNWSPVTYKNNYFKLQETGLLTPTSYTVSNNINFNSWNLDLRYIWQFARGSKLVILYRNAIFNENDQSQLSFSKNLKNLFKQSLQQNLSIRLVYYLDYNKVKTWL